MWRPGGRHLAGAAVLVIFAAAGALFLNGDGGQAAGEASRPLLEDAYAAPATPPNTQAGTTESSPQPVQPAETSNENAPEEDLPFMDELPDVL